MLHIDDKHHIIVWIKQDHKKPECSFWGTSIHTIVSGFSQKQRLYVQALTVNVKNPKVHIKQTPNIP